MENQNENQLSLENAAVGLDLPGFELDERFDVGFGRLFPGRQDLNRASSDRRSRAARGSEVVARVRSETPRAIRPTREIGAVRFLKGLQTALGGRPQATAPATRAIASRAFVRPRGRIGLYF